MNPYWGSELAKKNREEKEKEKKVSRSVGAAWRKGK